jgi:thioredoxin reductase (NADPH)
VVDCIIIGSGPAGIAASIYANRYNIDFVLIDKDPITGGKATIPHLIENLIGFPDGISGYDFSVRLSDQLSKSNIKLVNFNCTAIIKEGDSYTIESTDKKKLETKSLIIAAGTNEKELGIKGEIEFKGKGVSYCATCDAPFFKNKIVSVIGGGDTSLTESLYLSEFAQKVYIIYRRENLRGAEILQERIKKRENIDIIFNSIPIEIIGKDYVKSIAVKNVLTEKDTLIDNDGIFIFAGYTPNTNLVRDLVKLDNDGYILTDEDMKTSKTGIYAAGDIRNKNLRQIVTAISDGAIAAHSIRKYLKENI